MTAALAVLAVPGALCVPAAADAPADRLDLVPAACRGVELCRTEAAEVYGRLAAGERLAVLTALVDGQQVLRQVYDDGSGFEPAPPFVPHGSDAGHVVDYAASVPVPFGGRHEVTFVAEDREGGRREVTTVVRGALAPSRVTDVRVRPYRRSVRLAWGRVADDHGGLVRSYRVSVDGGAPRWVGERLFGTLPELAVTHLRPGRHRLEIRAVNSAGRGTPTRVGFVLPR